MGATTSRSIQGPNQDYARYLDMIHQTIVPPNISSKGDASFRNLDVYRYANDVRDKSHVIRPVRTAKQAYYATRPTFLGKGGPTHLIGAIPEKALQYIPTSLTSDESIKIKTAYNLLLHTLNVCAIVLGSETPSPDEKEKNKVLLQTLNTLYKGGSTPVSTAATRSDTTSMRSRMLADIASNASATIANIEDRAQQLRKENAFLVFADNRSVIQDINQYITPTRQSPAGSSQPFVKSDQLSIFRAVLQHVNTLTVCGTKPNTLLGRLSKSGEYPDILTLVVSDMAALLETLLPDKSPTIRTMIRWAKSRLQSVSAYGSKEDSIVEGTVLKRLFMKQGTALQKATEDACVSLTKKFGQFSFPTQTDGVVVHTADKGDSIKRGTPVQKMPRSNKAASQLYSLIQRENRAMGDAAMKTFESLFEITTSPVPGSINLPIKVNGADKKDVYATVRSSVIQSSDPIGTLAGAAAVLVYTIAVAYDNLWTIVSKENMKKIYGLND